MATFNYTYQNPHTPQEYQSLINTIISVLVKPEQSTTVARTYANDKNLATEVQAYAKLSGKDWTYYVKNLDVSIGRNTDNILNNNNIQTLDTDGNVDIDLGPGKVVSRRHASIVFNTGKGGWELHVSGRNGAKVNFERVHTGTEYPPVKLSSGTILDIGGTQMMFILPDTEPMIPDSTFEALMPKILSMLGPSGQSNNRLLNEIIRNSVYFRQQQQQLQEIQRGQRAAAQPMRTFKMYGSSANLPFPNGAQFIQPSVPANSINSNGTYLPGESSGISNKDFKNHSKSSSSASGSSTSSRFPNSLSVSGFPHAIDFASDLSREENKTVKPPHSYATMITQAILSSKEGIISLADIYKFIASNYAYYRFAKTGWQNSIRHNLSLNKAFEKVPRRPNEPGKGMKWRISVAFQKDFIEKWNNGNLSKIKRGSSVIRQLQLHMSKYNSLPIQRYPEQNSNNYDNNDNIVQANVDTDIKDGSDNIDTPSNSNIILNNEIANMNNNQVQLINNAGTLRSENTGKSVQDSTDIQIKDLRYQNVYQNEGIKDTFNQRLKPNLENTTGMLDGFNNISTNPTNNALVSFNNASSGTWSGPSSTNNSTSTAPSIMNNSDMEKSSKNSSIDNNSNALPTIRTSLYSSSILPTNQISLSGAPAPALNSGSTGIPSTYDTLLRSPSKSFHITAMEAYTPERGSAMQNKSPKQENASNPNSKPELDTLGIKGITPKFTPSTIKSQSIVKSSPGMLNLLQFSSVNNTPKLDIINGKGEEGSKKDNFTDNDNNTDSGKDLVSSPIKRPVSNNSIKSESITRELILNTDNAKVTIVND